MVTQYLKTACIYDAKNSYTYHIKIPEGFPKSYYPNKFPDCNFVIPPRVRKQENIIYYDNHTLVIDLHIMTRKEAFKWSLSFIQNYLYEHVEFITGKGLHCIDERPVIKTIVKNILQDCDFSYFEKPQNSGRVCAYLEKKKVIIRKKK